MTVSEKQLKANKKNAQKDGVKTPEGKAIVKYNALKHGLLAKEAVITVGEGAWKQDKRDFTKMHKDGKPFEEIYDWGENWEWLEDKFKYLLIGHEDYEGFDPKNFREFLNNSAGWSDEQIWEADIELCDENIDEHKKEIADL